MLALYIHRDSPLHRLPAGVKLLACLAGTTTIALLDSPWALAAGLLITLLLYRLARLPAGAVTGALAPLLLIGGTIIALQVALSGWQEAGATALRLPALVLLASLVTFTTPLSGMIETATRAARPLARFGMSPPKVGLAITLALRFIPALAKDWREIERARAARGGSGLSVMAIGPLVLRILSMTNALGDAIAARDFDSRS
jgi:biotin transport system permease protein